MIDTPAGVLVVDKPTGPTSHDIVDRVRRSLRTRRVGHTGTLDPFASGVLVLCLGQATRLARFLSEGEKHYDATVRLGQATDTDDATGQPLDQELPVEVPIERLRTAVAALTGEIEQLPPRYSAKSVGGQRLYALARRGEDAPRSPCRVSVHELSVLEFAPPLLRLRVRCSTGTYVRALARDLGLALGVGGHLAELRRTRNGGFGLAGAWNGDPAIDPRPHIVPLRELLHDWPAAVLDSFEAARFRNGQHVDKPQLENSLGSAGHWRCCDLNGDLIGIARSESAAGMGLRLRPELVLARSPHADVAQE